MATNIKLKTFNGSQVTPQNDAILYDTAVSSKGLYKGAEVTYTGGNTLHISSGFGQIKGRQFEIYDSDLIAALPSSGSVYGQVYVHIDLANADEPAQIIVETADILTPMVQDENINYDNGQYDMQLATFVANVSTITGLVNVAPTVYPSGGHAMLHRGQGYAVGDVAYTMSAPSWTQFVCTTAGTTAAVEPEAYKSVSYVGETVTDGTAVFTVADARMPAVDDLRQELDALIEAIQGGTDLLSEFQEYFLSQKQLFNAETVDEINAMLLSAQIQINNAKDACISSVTQFRNEQQQIFSSWFAGIRGQLSTDAAGHLQNEVDDLRDGLANKNQGVTTSFPNDGVLETYDDGRKIVTTYNDDGSITEQAQTAGGIAIWTRTTTYMSNGNIREEVDNG